MALQTATRGGSHRRPRNVAGRDGVNSRRNRPSGQLLARDTTPSLAVAPLESSSVSTSVAKPAATNKPIVVGLDPPRPSAPRAAAGQNRQSGGSDQERRSDKGLGRVRDEGAGEAQQHPAPACQREASRPEPEREGPVDAAPVDPDAARNVAEHGARR